MRSLPIVLLLLLAAGCGTLRPAAPGQPGVQLRAAPNVRVVALDVLPHEQGWTLAGHLELPQPVLEAERNALVEGLDDQGAVLFAQPVVLHLRPMPPRFGEPRPASFRATLPAHPGLLQLRLTLASGR